MTDTDFERPPADEPVPTGRSVEGAPDVPDPPDDGVEYVDVLAGETHGDLERRVAAALALPTGEQLVAYGMTLRKTNYGPPENVNRFTRAYYGDGTSASWCLIFIWFCLNHFGAAGLIGGKIAYVPNLRARVGSKWHTSKSLIAEGDPVAFDFNRSGEPEHIGLFVKWLNAAHTIFESLEGNTTSGGSDDAVVTKTRNWSDVFGYVKPGLAPANPAAYPGKVYKYDADHLMSDSHVGWIQGRLNAHGAHLTVDDDFGKKTRDATKAFQAKNGLAPDGEVGGKTWPKLAA